MYEYSFRRTCVISTCSLNQIAIIRKIFTRISFSIYKELYSELPEITIADKITKLRFTHNLKREDLADLLNMHWDTIEGWEVHNIMPKPQSIRKLCDYFNLPYNYFHEYYNIYFNNPGDKIKTWKIKNKLTYGQACKLLGITHSCFGRLLNNKINLSYYIYAELKKLGAF